MQYLLLLGLVLASGCAWAGTPVPATTVYTRDFLRATDAAGARTKLGVTVTNGAIDEAASYDWTGDHTFIGGNTTISNATWQAGASGLIATELKTLGSIKLVNALGGYSDVTGSWTAPTNFNARYGRFNGNGSGLTNIPASAITNLPTADLGNARVESVEPSWVLWYDGSTLTNHIFEYQHNNRATVFSDNVHAKTNIVSEYGVFYGDGSGLTNITVGSADPQQIIDIIQDAEMTYTYVDTLTNVTLRNTYATILGRLNMPAGGDANGSIFTRNPIWTTNGIVFRWDDGEKYSSFENSYLTTNAVYLVNREGVLYAITSSSTNAATLWTNALTGEIPVQSVGLLKVATTNVISSAGSKISNVGFTNGVLYGSASGLTDLPASSGGGGTNSGPIVLTVTNDDYDTNVAVSAVTPVGCVTNGIIPYRLTVSTNVLIENPTGMLDGQRITIEFIQDATGNRKAFFGDKFTFGSDITGVTLSTTAAKVDFATFIYNSTADKWRCVGFVRGY